MRYAFLIPLFLAALFAIGLLGGESRPIAPYVMTALLGAAWMMYQVGREV